MLTETYVEDELRLVFFPRKGKRIREREFTNVGCSLRPIVNYSLTVDGTPTGTLKNVL